MTKMSVWGMTFFNFREFLSIQDFHLPTLSKNQQAETTVQNYVKVT